MLGDNGNTWTQNSNTVATTIEITASKKNTANILNISSSSKYLNVNIIITGKKIYLQITASKNIQQTF